MKKSEINGTCEQCGAALKYPVLWQGHIYGSECFQHVSGIKVFPQEIQGKSQEVIQSLVACRLQERQQFQEWKANRQKVNALVNDRYSWLISYLKSLSTGLGHDFPFDMAELLEEESESIFLDDIFSPRQLDIIADIYAKQYGRKGSKAFKSHREEFFNSVELREAL